MGVFKTSLILGLLVVMFAQGMRLQPRHLLGFRHALGLLVRAFIAVDLLVPLAAVAVLALFRPDRPVAIGLAVMAASPVGTLGLRSAVRNLRLRETWSGIYFLLFVAAVVTTPLTLHLLDRIVGFETSVSPVAIGTKVLGWVVFPVAAGMAFLRIAPRAAERGAPSLEKAGMLLIALSFAVVVFVEWRTLADFALRDYAAVALFVVLCLTLGYLLGGHDPEARRLLATESAARHITLALLIAETNAPHARIATVFVPYLVTFLVVTNAYRFWKDKASHGGTGGRMTTSPS